GEILKAGQAVAPAAGRGLRDDDRVVRRLCAEALLVIAGSLADLITQADSREFPPANRPPTEDERKDIELFRQGRQAEQEEVRPVSEALRDQAGAVARLLNDPAPEIRALAARTLEEMGNARQKLLRRAASVPAVGVEKPQGTVSLAPSAGAAAARVEEESGPV